MNRSEENSARQSGMPASGAPVSGAHTLYLQNRETLHLSGVEEVVSFDDRNVLLRTALGMLSVDGEDLRVRRLDTERGEVTVEGRLCGMVYIDEAASPKNGKSRGVGRLFR